MKWLLAVVLVLLLAGVWTLAVFYPELRWFAEVLTASVVVATLALLLLPWTIARLRRASEADRASAGEAAPGAPRTPLRTEFRRALRDVRRKRGRRHVRTAPRLLVLTTGAADVADVLAALDFERSTPDDPAPPEAVWQVWHSREALAVVVSAPADGDRRAPRALFNELARSRPREPLDGVLVSFAVEELGDDAAAGRARCSSVRAQLASLADDLGVVLPVYLLVTHADHVPGFVPFSSTVATPDDPWGASFPDDRDSPPAAGPAMARELDELARAQHGWLLEHLPKLSNAVDRVAFLRFPSEWRARSAPLTEMVDAIWGGAGAPAAFLRGVYFVAAPSSDPERGRRARVGQGAAAVAVRGAHRPYFVSGVLRSVIVPDRAIAAASAVATRRLRRIDLWMALAGLVGAAALLVPALVSHVHNVETIDAVRDAGRALARPEPDTIPGLRQDPIEPALDVIERCDRDAAGASVAGWFGPTAAREMRRPLAAAYVGRLRAFFLQRLRPELQSRLDAIAQARALADSPTAPEEESPLSAAYDTVKLYAVLVDPRGHARDDWAAQHLAASWRALLAGSPAAVDDERLVRHARRYLDALEADPSLAWPADLALTRARQRLVRLDVGSMAYRRMLLAARDVPPLRASALFGPAALAFVASRGDVQVAGAFTASGWQKIQEVLHRVGPLPPGGRVDAWVLGEAGVPADEPALRAQLRKAYFDEYPQRWMAFLDELRVRTPADVETAKAELVALKDSDGFYRPLFDAFAKNAIRDEPAGSAFAFDAGALLSRLPWFQSNGPDAGPAAGEPSPVEKAFRPLLAFAGYAEGAKGASAPPLDKYLVILDQLKAALDAPPPPHVAGQPAPDPFAEASRAAGALLDGVEEPLRGRLLRLMMPPVTGGINAAKVAEASSVSDDWKSTVWTAWQTKIDGRYPFGRARSDAVTFADFAAFFKPEGTLWTFVHAHLGDRIEQNGQGRYVPRPGADPLSGDALAFFTRAQEITDAFFPSGEDPGLKFSVQADWAQPNVAGAKFWIGGKDTELPKGQWASPVRWLGEDVRLQWLQDGRAIEELGRHTFSLFDLFDQFGGLKPSPFGRSFYVFECPPLSVKVRPEGKSDAFRADFFARIACPQELVYAKP